MACIHRSHMTPLPGGASETCGLNCCEKMGDTRVLLRYFSVCSRCLEGAYLGMLFIGCEES